MEWIKQFPRQIRNDLIVEIIKQEQHQPGFMVVDMVRQLPKCLNTCDDIRDIAEALRDDARHYVDTHEKDATMQIITTMSKSKNFCYFALQHAFYRKYEEFVKIQGEEDLEIRKMFTLFRSDWVFTDAYGDRLKDCKDFFLISDAITPITFNCHRKRPIVVEFLKQLDVWRSEAAV